MKKFILTLMLMVLFSSNVFALEIFPEKSDKAVGNVLGLVVDTTNESNGATSYYYMPLVQEGWSAFSAQHKITNATITYEGSNDTPDVANASATWTDITSMLTDGASATFTSNGFLSVNQLVPWSRIRIKRLTTSGTNEVEIRLTRFIAR